MGELVGLFIFVGAMVVIYLFSKLYVSIFMHEEQRLYEEKKEEKLKAKQKRLEDGEFSTLQKLWLFVLFLFVCITLTWLFFGIIGAISSAPAWAIIMFIILLCNKN